MTTLDEVRGFLLTATDDQRHAVMKILRLELGLTIHPLERRWRTNAEAVLEAIDRASDLTQRGVRGVLAEATFATVVVPRALPGWSGAMPGGEAAYDLLLDDGSGAAPVRVQVKLQRRNKGEPMVHRKSPGAYVVETQRTRSGTRGGAKTRPYRLDEFDVLAVCMQPLSGSWEDFVYCAVRDLVTRPAQPDLLEVLQPIRLPENGNQDATPWTREFRHVADRARGL